MFKRRYSETVIRLLLRFRWRMLVILGMCTLMAAPFAWQATDVENELAIWFVGDSPAWERYQRFQQMFGSSDFLVVGVETSRGFRDAPALDRLTKVSDEISAIPGVDRVYSLSRVRHVLGKFVDFRSPSSAITDPPSSLLTLLGDFFLNEAATGTLLYAQLDVAQSELTSSGSIPEKIRTAAASEFGASNTSLGGISLVYQALNEATQRDFWWLMTGGWIVMLALLYLLFRRRRVVVMGLIIMLTAVVITLGIYGLAGHSLNLLSVVIPALITILGMADLVHIVNTYDTIRGPGLPSDKARLRAALITVLPPCLFTTLTTATGFWVLGISPIPGVQLFGFYSGIGIVVAFVVSFVTASCLLLPSAAEPSPTTQDRRSLAKSLRGLVGFLRRQTILVGSGGTVILSIVIAGVQYLDIETSPIRYLPDDHPVAIDHRSLEQRFGSYIPVDLVVEAAPGRQMTDPHLLQDQRRFAREVSRISGIRTALGIHDVLSVFERDNPLSVPVPDVGFRSELIHTFLDIAGPALPGLLSADRGHSRMVLLGPMATSTKMLGIVNQITTIGNSHFEDRAKVRLAGLADLYQTTVTYIQQTQIWSLILAAGVALLLIGLFLGNLRMASLAMVPNLFPVACIFGIMGWVGVPVDILTVTVAAVVVGIAVDDTIHLLYHYVDRRRTDAFADALALTLQRVGRAAVFTTVIVAAGLLVLVGASVSPVVAFGGLTALALVLTLFGDLIVLPLLLYLFDRQ